MPVRTFPLRRYLALLLQKTSMWSAYMLSQWGVVRAISVTDTNTMSQEASSLRSQWAWSVPTAEALAAIARHSPLIEIGAGNGHWAALLRARGADVLAYDEPCWAAAYAAGAAGGAEATPAGTPLMGEREAGVLAGGPEQAAGHAGRALMLAWPDYAGRGSYGTQCLAAYTGDTLVLLGEWTGRTLGAYADGLGEHGQSFSIEFQRRVEADWVLVEQMRLPSWPYFVDSLHVWKRRATAGVDVD